MPAETFSHTTVASTTLEAAYRALQDATTWESIGGVDEVTDPHHAPDGRLLGYRFAAAAGGKRYDGRASVTGSEPLSRMTVEIDTSELSGVIDVMLTESSDGVEVRVDLNVRSKGFLASIAFPVIAGAIGSGLPANVEAFAARLA